MEFTHKEWVVRKKREADAYALTRPSYHFPLKWKREFLPKEIEAMKNQFGQFDADRSGAIDADELLGILNSLGEDVGREQVEALIREVDHNNSRELEFDEFVELMHNLRHSRSRSGAAAALQAAQYGVRIAAELRALQGRRALPGVVAKETKAPETDNAHASGAPPDGGGGGGGGLSKAAARGRRRSLAAYAAAGREPPAVVPLAVDALRHPSWDVVFEGAAGTPYGGGVFLCRVSFSPEYPYAPPSMIFETRLQHINFPTMLDGRAHAKQALAGWDADWDARRALAAVAALLAKPDVALAREWARRLASDDDGSGRGTGRAGGERRTLATRPPGYGRPGQAGGGGDGAATTGLVGGGSLPSAVHAAATAAAPRCDAQHAVSLHQYVTDRERADCLAREFTRRYARPEFLVKKPSAGLEPPPKAWAYHREGGPRQGPARAVLEADQMHFFPVRPRRSGMLRSLHLHALSGGGRVRLALYRKLPETAGHAMVLVGRGEGVAAVRDAATEKVLGYTLGTARTEAAGAEAAALALGQKELAAAAAAEAAAAPAAGVAGGDVGFNIARAGGGAGGAAALLAAGRAAAAAQANAKRPLPPVELKIGARDVTATFGGKDAPGSRPDMNDGMGGASRLGVMEKTTPLVVAGAVYYIGVQVSRATAIPRDPAVVLGTEHVTPWRKLYVDFEPPPPPHDPYAESSSADEDEDAAGAGTDAAMGGGGGGAAGGEQGEEFPDEEAPVPETFREVSLELQAMPYAADDCVSWCVWMTLGNFEELPGSSDDEDEEEE